MEIENFSFLIPGALAGMSYPRSASILADLVRLGFRSLVALGQPPQGPVPAGLRIYHRELPDFARIPAEMLHRVVETINQGEPMVVSLRHGCVSC